MDSMFSRCYDLSPPDCMCHSLRATGNAHNIIECLKIAEIFYNYLSGYKFCKDIWTNKAFIPCECYKILELCM